MFLSIGETPYFTELTWQISLLHMKSFPRNTTAYSRWLSLVTNVETGQVAQHFFSISLSKIGIKMLSLLYGFCDWVKCNDICNLVFTSALHLVKHHMHANHYW
jgi:hypothetical protein